MFQEIHLNKYHKEANISQAYITTKGVAVLASKMNTIAIFHHSSPTHIINPEYYLGHRLNYKKCVCITSL